MFSYECKLCGVKREYKDAHVRNVAKHKHFKGKRHTSKQQLQETKKQLKLCSTEDKRKQILDKYQILKNYNLIKKMEQKNGRKKDKLLKRINELENTIYQLIKHIKYPNQFKCPSLQFRENDSPPKPPKKSPTFL